MKTLFRPFPRFDKSTHDDLVRRTAMLLRQRGHWNVRADVWGYFTPERIVWPGTDEGHIPDVTSSSTIIEVETAFTISDEHTRSQCDLFSRHATMRRMQFVVVVPMAYQLRMQVQLRAWGIQGQVWQL